jgi:hypothetical protein
MGGRFLKIGMLTSFVTVPLKLMTGVYHGSMPNNKYNKYFRPQKLLTDLVITTILWPMPILRFFTRKAIGFHNIISSSKRRR